MGRHAWTSFSGGMHKWKQHAGVGYMYLQQKSQFKTTVNTHMCETQNHNTNPHHHMILQGTSEIPGIVVDANIQ